MLGPFATASRRYIASHQVSLVAHQLYSAGGVRCPQRRERQRVTEGTAMAPWNGPLQGEAILQAKASAVLDARLASAGAVGR